jgi:hypothetical protein
MGGYKGISNPEFEGAKIDPNKTFDCCGSSILFMFVPPIVLSIARAITPDRFTTRVGFDDLADDLVALTRPIASLEPAQLRYRTRAGVDLAVSLAEPRREGDDLHAGLELQVGGAESFSGRLTVLGAFRRGRTTLALSLLGALHLLYDHLRQEANGETVQIAIGVIRIDGRAADPQATRQALARNVARRRRKALGDFDEQIMYGVFPDDGFAHFHGDFVQLADTPVA